MDKLMEEILQQMKYYNSTMTHGRQQPHVENSGTGTNTNTSTGTGTGTEPRRLREVTTTRTHIEIDTDMELGGLGTNIS